MLKCRNFISKFNLVNGKMEWHLLGEQYDYKYEIRSSGYADMLNDNDRNSKYYNALRKVITRMKKNCKRVHVLDIGCGSGMLSMMALKLGADKVTACESFEPMYHCAKKVISDNGLLTERIDLIHLSSLDLKVGVNMSEKANVLVSEIFDSELIGEGVLRVFEHAISNLLVHDAIVIPQIARLFVQPVMSRLLRDHNYLSENKYLVKFPLAYYKCTGYSSGYDVQASSVICDTTFTVLSPPTLAKVIDFSGKYSLANDSSVYVPVNMDAFVFWWELVMVGCDGSNISTAPLWSFKNACEIQSNDDKTRLSNDFFRLNFDNTNLNDNLMESNDVNIRSDYDRIQSKDEYKWRDHWLQMVLYLPLSDIGCDRVRLIHDTHSIWIDSDGREGHERPRCICGLHTHIPRSRLCQLNSDEYHSYVDYITKVVETHRLTTCAVISDFSYLPLSLEASGVSTINIIEHDAVRHLTQTFLAGKGIAFTSVNDVDNGDIDAVIGDPFFVCSLLPWDDIHFWYQLDKIRYRLTGDNSLISPRTMVIKAMLVQFEHLYKIASPVGRIEGFVMDGFDDLIRSRDDRIRPNDERVRSTDDEKLHFESRFLWEYDGRARSDVVDLLTLDLTRSVADLLEHGTMEFSNCHQFHSSQVVGANALVIWTAWEVGDGLWIDFSLDKARCNSSGNIAWKPVTRQAVHFLGEDVTRSNVAGLRVSCCFNLLEADFKFCINS